MAQRVKEMVSDEIIDESVVKKQIQEAKKHLEEEKVPTASVGRVEEAKKELKEEIKEADEEVEKGKKKEKKDLPAGKAGKKPERKSLKPKHSKKYLAALAKIEKSNIYTIDEAIDKVLETSITKFDATVEIHARLAVGGIRGMIVLPAGAPKEKKVVEISDANVDDIIAKIKTNKLDFDILIATPSVMPKLAAVARILGPKGLMPSPKSGTVVEDIKKTLEEIKSGKVEYKQDDQKNIHLGIAKVSFGKEKIKENLQTFLKILPKNKVSALYLASTMGPSVKMEIPK